MDSKQVEDLLEKYLNGEVSPAQAKLIEEWLEKNRISTNEWQQMSGEEREQWQGSLATSIQREIWGDPESVDDADHTLVPGRSRHLFFRAVAAAVFVLFTAGAVYWFYNDRDEALPVLTIEEPAADDAFPATNKAVLTLGDGSEVVLDEKDGDGLLAQEGNTALRKKGDQVIYNSGEGFISGREITYNTLTTPKGGQYRLVLPDGSKVWLNADSRLRYPVAFPKDKRTVELNGEAYFEVASKVNGKSKVPFTVQVVAVKGDAKADIHVLGTDFNINSYDDEQEMYATLLKGKVHVVPREGLQEKVSALLQPGQQAKIKASGEMEIVKDANIEEVMAWKNGLFIMNKAPVAAVLRQLGRWYDVEVEYRNGVPDGRISGDMPRDMKLSEMLKVIQLSGIKFKIAGKKIIVEP